MEDFINFWILLSEKNCQTGTERNSGINRGSKDKTCIKCGKKRQTLYQLNK